MDDDSAKRKSGIAPIDYLPWGTAFRYFYQSEKEMLDILVPFLTAGLEGNELCLWIVSSPLTIDEAENILKGTVNRFEEYFLKRQVRIVSEARWFGGSGTTAGAAVTAFVDEALSAGFDGLRFACNVLPVKGQTGTSECFGAEAAGFDGAIGAYAYPRAGFDAADHLNMAGDPRFSLVNNGGKWEILAPMNKEYIAAREELRKEIAERRRAEEALRESEIRYRDLVRYAPAAIYAIDYTTGRFTEVNDVMCAILGYTRGELLAMGPDDILTDGGKEQFASRMRRIRSGEQPLTEEEFQIRTKNGRLLWSLVNSTYHRKDGRIVGASVIANDITDRKRAETELKKYREELEKLVDERTAELRENQEQLLHAQKMEAVGQLAGGIAHDFNNMMQVVMGFAYHTLCKLDFENPLRKNLEHIAQAAKSASVLTHQLLAFSRKQLLQPQVFLLDDLVLKIKPMLRHTLGEDIVFSFDLQSERCRVKADPTQIEQVIMNMAVNARNAMADGGNLMFKTAPVMLGEVHPFDKDPVPSGPYVMLAISDTGCGMNKEIMGRIFEPFFTTRPFGSGSGLGLSTAYGIIRQSAGAIRVYSEPGKGTTFKIYLPRSEEEIQPDKPIDVEHFPKEKGKTVLIVEDNGMVLDFILLELRDRGHHALVARNGEEAFSVARNFAGPIHLLLTDVVLPGMSGLEVSKTLTAERPGMSTLFMSGYDREHILKQGKLVAGVGLLVKPFSPEQLVTAVREALNSAASEAGEPAGKPPFPGRPGGTAGPFHILVIDDDPGIADIIADVLREPGNRVLVAEDGATAMKLVSEFRPGVVLLDIKLPDIDGYELARRIRATGDGPAPFIIAASGYAPERGNEKEFFDEYMIKPIDFPRLKESIAARVKMKPARE